MVGDLLFGVQSQQNRVLAEDVQIVREWEGYSLSICCPQASQLPILESFIQSAKSPQWHLASDEPDFVNDCADDVTKQHVLFLWS